MNAADTAWILAAFTAVSLMVPGLALFYGGMTSVKSTLNMMMMVLGAAAVVAVLWVAFGYSAVLGNSYGGLGLLGDLGEYAGLGQVLTEDPEASLPPALVAAFQALFACITVALLAGGVADRMRFGSWLVLAGLWAALVYFPVAHWVFAFDSADGSVLGGWIANDLAAVDFAGGTAVHVNAGIGALAVVLVLGKRLSWPRTPRPHNLPTTLLGAGILWFGWFGFNGGSALSAGNSAAVVVLTTFCASCSGLLGWLLVERVRDGHATTLGAVSGIIAGLVAITPACGAVSPVGALVVGAVAGAVCPLAIGLKRRFGYDDALDVVGVHLVGGVVGTLLVGFLGTSDAPSGRDGLLHGGGFGLLGVQAAAVGAVLAYSFVVTLLIALVLDKTMGLRLPAEAEEAGVDLSVHAETAYDLTPAGAGVPEAPAVPGAHERITAHPTRSEVPPQPAAAAPTVGAHGEG
ncbi:ammonium transporter [Kineococcus arenarius]|uniref:ammonium transporter n=1 Tax=unclassified Kineococcus TaxID=2621656 RepID=UPI003D7F0B2A